MVNLARTKTFKPVYVQNRGRPKGGANLSELALGHPVPVENDPGWLVAGRLVELDQELPNHRRQVLDDLLPGPLDPDRGAVPAGVGVHAAHHLWRKSSRLIGLISGNRSTCVTIVTRMQQM